jgi:hypothetical protein
MNITDLPSDIWRIIAKSLSKRDLLTLELSSNLLMLTLEKIPDIWWGKHLQEYQLRWNEYYNNNKSKTSRDKNLENFLLKLNPNPRIIRKCNNTFFRDSNTDSKREILRVLANNSVKPVS